MNLAIIPARGGSKRIPNKNIKNFAGKPIIAYSINTARKAEIYDHVIVSTDSEGIAKIARQYGAEVPFIRPPELSDDATPTAPVLLHAIQWLADNGESPSYSCCIYATAPFVRPDDIINGFKIITGKKVSSVFSVTTFAFPIFRALRITNSGQIEMFWPEYETTRSQDLPEAYHDAGQFYWFEVRQILKTKKIYSNDALPVILPRYLVQDIDTPEDWETAEVMYTACKERDLL